MHKNDKIRVRIQFKKESFKAYNKVEYSEFVIGIRFILKVKGLQTKEIVPH